MPIKRTKKLRGGQSSKYEEIYANFLGKFGADPTMTSNQIQKQVSAQLETQLASKQPEEQIPIIANTLNDYISAIVAVQQAFQNNKSNFQAKQSNFQKQQAVDIKYGDLVKKTDSIVRDFDKYLLKDMSFIRINPKKDVLLNDLSQRMKKIVDTYQLELTSNIGAENYTINTAKKTLDIQNKIMISVIQNLLENIRPIYSDMKSNNQPLKTNATRNSTRRILEDIDRERTIGTQLHTDFSQNIGNWIKLLTQIIELNATVINSSQINSPNATKKLGTFHLEYQEAQKNINNLLSSVVSTNKPKDFFHPKFKNEVFVQELVSEVFRWGMAAFKIYKYNQFIGQTVSQTPSQEKLKQN